MILFIISCLIAFYLLTIHDSRKVKQVIWPVTAVMVVVSLISLLTMEPDTVTYVFWLRIFSLLFLIPILMLVIRKIWQLSAGTTKWIQYAVVIPVSLLFIVTLWVSWKMLPIVLYIL